MSVPEEPSTVSMRETLTVPAAIIEAMSVPLLPIRLSIALIDTVPAASIVTASAPVPPTIDSIADTEAVAPPSLEFYFDLMKRSKSSLASIRSSSTKPVR
jgi:hypothetical protein